MEGCPWHGASPWPLVPAPPRPSRFSLCPILGIVPSPGSQQGRTQVWNHEGGSPRQHILGCCREVAQGAEGTCWKKRGQAALAVGGVRAPRPAAATGTPPPAFQPGLSGSCSDRMFKLKKRVGNTKNRIARPVLPWAHPERPVVRLGSTPSPQRGWA